MRGSFWCVFCRFLLRRIRDEEIGFVLGLIGFVLALIGAERSKLALFWV